MEVTTPPVIEIERNPKRCGGSPTLAGTRTTIHDVVANVRLYDGDIERMIEEFPHFTVEVVEAIMAWYRDHQEEIDDILLRRREEYQRLLAKSRAGRQPVPVPRSCCSMSTSLLPWPTFVWNDGRRIGPCFGNGRRLGWDGQWAMRRRVDDVVTTVLSLVTGSRRYPVLVSA